MFVAYTPSNLFQLALEYGIKFLETSAKAGDNIEKVNVIYSLQFVLQV